MAIQYLPDVNTGSELYEQWYYRYTVNTSWLPLSQFVAFIGLAVYGWAFINLVNMQRKDPFISGNYAHYLDIKQMLLVAPIIFFFSGVVIFRQANDLAGYLGG